MQDFWNGQKHRSEKERDAKLELRSALQLWQNELSNSLKCVRDVLPS